MRRGTIRLRGIVMSRSLLLPWCFLLARGFLMSRCLLWARSLPVPRRFLGRGGIGMRVAGGPTGFRLRLWFRTRGRFRHTVALNLFRRANRVVARGTLRTSWMPRLFAAGLGRV